MQWKGSVALITGASRGIGRALAIAAHRRGARLGLVARGRAELEALAGELGEGAAWATADVGDAAQVGEAVASIERQLGPVDILVNNAGIGAYAPFSHESIETIEKVMRINYLGTVYATKAVVPGMIERRRGHLVNVSSVAGKVGAPFEAAYCASKFAVSGLTECLHTELSPFGIGVSMVNPGPVETDFFDARGVPYARQRPRPVPAERISDAILAAVERDVFEQIIPGWIRVAAVFGALLPSFTRAGTRREFTTDLAEYVRRIESEKA